MQKSSEISELRNELSCTVIYCSYIKISLLEIGKEGNFFTRKLILFLFFLCPRFPFQNGKKKLLDGKLLVSPHYVHCDCTCTTKECNEKCDKLCIKNKCVKRQSLFIRNYLSWALGKQEPSRALSLTAIPRRNKCMVRKSCGGRRRLRSLFIHSPFP